MWKWIIIGVIAIAGMFALLLKGGGNVSMLGEAGGDHTPPAAEAPKAEAPKAEAPKADAPAAAAANPAPDAAKPAETPAAPPAPQTK